ncbi:carbon-monoxide dehydrogenase large subunit [Limimonas halophila]|uniref:Carbon-monoxide dehydrogenase large subunit n=1 Tax=Limimonas halophila TaxID=1082479 RepID=A0A1G7PUE4_9PROT|nr:xanthine dehydrogenase family protein molybdopterin-binding subunit [Limimonas halophila]SDF89942.1 carbon-monoxide dehydrogenase large subunit [Limimonas halophila]
MGQFGFGQAVRRVEDTRLLTGHGSYTDDLGQPGDAHLKLVRSPHAHAVISAVDTTEAREQPGVLAVYTCADLDARGIGDIPCLAPMQGRDGNPGVTPGHPVLARGRVRHVGDPVAAVVAESAEVADAAAELVEVDYEPLDAVTEGPAALREGAPQLHEQAPNNLALDWEIGDPDGTADAVAQAEHVTRLQLVNNRVVVNALEPRAARGSYDAETGEWHLATATQGVFGLRRQLAEQVLGVDQDRIRVTTPDVGGGFGMKIFLYADQVLVLLAAQDVGRPVRFTASRGDDFVSASQGRDHVTDAALGFDGSGRITGLWIDTVANIGAYVSNMALFVATQAGARMYPGAYVVPAVYGRTRVAFTNTVPVDAYRGAGRPEAAYLIERLMDTAARELGMDPAALRRRNFVPPEAMPHTTATGLTYDCGQFARLQDTALENANAAGLAERKREARTRGKLRGLGHASYLECCGGIGSEEARFRLDADGGVTLSVGTQSNGQGHATAYAQMVADKLGLTPEQVRVRQGDTRDLNRGGGTGGSRSVIMGGGAATAATDKAVERMKRIAGHLLEASPSDLDFAEGRFAVAGTDIAVSFQAVAEAAHGTDLPAELQGGVDETAQFSEAGLTYPNGCHVCELEVDEATGHVDIVRYVIVDDMGTILNPLMLRGQIHGGAVQGIGQALLEHTVYDADSGQLLTATFQDYTMPRAADVPDFEIAFVEDIPTPSNPWGIKGAGEAGSIGAPPAVMNALVDALQPYGVRHLDMPATPERVWRAMHGAG